MESGFIKRIGDVIIQRVGPPHGSMTPPPGDSELDPDGQGEISPELPPGSAFRPELGLDPQVGSDRRIEEEHDELPDDDHDDVGSDRAPMVPSVMDDDFVPDLPEDDLNEDPEPDSHEADISSSRTLDEPMSPKYLWWENRQKDDENDRSDEMDPHVDDELEEGDDVLAGLKGAGDGVALMESEDLLREIKPEPMEQDGQDEDDDGNDPEDREDEGTGQDDESGKRKQESDNEEEKASKKKKSEEEESEKKKNAINLRRNIREVMDENQLDEATLAAQRQEAERLRRVQDQQKYLREIQIQRQLQIQKNRQARMMSFLQGGSGSASLMKAGQSSQSGRLSPSSKPNTVVVKLGSGGPPQLLNKKVLEAIRGGRSSPTPPDSRSGVSRIINKHMVTPSVSIAPVKPAAMRDGFEKKDGRVTPDVVTISSSDEDDDADKPTPVASVENKVKEEPEDEDDDCIVISEPSDVEEEEEDVDTNNSGMHTNDLFNCPDEQGRVLINVGKQDGEQEIFLAPQISRVIKPHQIGGVRFLFDNIIESVERYKTSTGFGCILAHSMGLGKTLQVVSFCDIFLRETPGRTIMCIMPINTLQNWVAEFNMWIPTDPSTSPLAAQGEVRARNFQIFVLNDLHKTIASRSRVVNEWKKEGGVLLIGYEMYRQLSLKKGRARKGKKKNPDEDMDDVKNKPHLESMHEALVKPGPDLVICDEGHRIKNSHASISHALKQIRTKRRVVLTGYPLQNNLLEYWCMVDFVRPNYLGTKTEFSNMFERPIQNGQCIDSTPQDIRLMRYRAHVLHSLLEGFVQRRSHSVLRNSLPQKEEYVLLVRMSAFQRQLYDTFMNEVVRTKAVPNPLKAFAVCCKIWNHPDILYHFLKKRELDELQDLELEETANLNPNQPADGAPRGKGETRGKKGKGKKAPQVPIKPAATVPPTNAQPEVKSESESTNFDYNRDQQNFQGQPPSSESQTGPSPQGDFKNFNSNFPGNNNYYQNYNSYQNFSHQEGGYNNYTQQQGDFNNFNYYQGGGNFGGGNNFYPAVKKEPEEFSGEKKEEIKFSQQKSLTGGQVVYNAPFGSNEFEPKKEFQQYNEWNQFGQQNYGYQWQPDQRGESKPKTEDGSQFGGQNVPYLSQQGPNYPVGESPSSTGGQRSQGFSGQPPPVAGPSHEYQQTGYSGQDVNPPSAGFGQAFGSQHHTQGQMGQFPSNYQTQDAQSSQINPAAPPSYGSASQKNPSFDSQGGPGNSQGFGNRAPVAGPGFGNQVPSNASQSFGNQTPSGANQGFGNQASSSTNQGFGNQALGNSPQSYGNQPGASSNSGFGNSPSGGGNQGFGNQALANNAPGFGSQGPASTNQGFGNQAAGCNTQGFGNQASGSVNQGFGTQTASTQGGNQAPGSVNQSYGTHSPASSSHSFNNQAPGSGTQGYGNQHSRTSSQGYGNQTSGGSSQGFGMQASGLANQPMQQGFGSEYTQTCSPSFPPSNINDSANNGAESQSFQSFGALPNSNDGFQQNFGTQPGATNPAFANAADQPSRAPQQNFPDYSNNQQGSKNIPPSQASTYGPGQVATGHLNYGERLPPTSNTQYQDDGQGMFSGQDIQRANQSFPQPAGNQPPAVQGSDYYSNFPVKNEPGVQPPNPEYSTNYQQKPSEFGAQTQNYFGGPAQQHNLFRPHQEPGSQKKEPVGGPQNPPAYGNEGFSAGNMPPAQNPASNYGATQSPIKSQQDNYGHTGGKTQDVGGYPVDNFGQMGEAQKYQDYQYGNMSSKAPQEAGYQMGNSQNPQEPQRMGNFGPKPPQESQPVNSFGAMTKNTQEMFGSKKHDQYGGVPKNAQEPAMQGFSQGPGKMHEQLGFNQSRSVSLKLPQDAAYGHPPNSKAQGTPGPGKSQDLNPPPYANKQQDPSYRSPGGSKGFNSPQNQYQMSDYGQASGQPEHLDMNMGVYGGASSEPGQSSCGAAAARSDQSSYRNPNSQEAMGYGYGVKGAQQNRMGYSQSKIEQTNPGMSVPQEGKPGFAGQGKMSQQYDSNTQPNPSQFPYQSAQGNAGYGHMDPQGYREYGQGSEQMEGSQMSHGMHSANQGAQMSSQGTQIQPSYSHQTSQGSQSDPNYYPSQNYNYEQPRTSYEPREKRGMSCQTEFDKDDRPLDKDNLGDRKDEDKKDDDKKAGDALVPVASGKAPKEDMGIPYDWATELLKGYVPGDIHASAKMTVFFCILEESIALGDRILLFSQSLFTLNLMEELLQRQNIPGKDEKWARNLNYYRLDGSTTAIEREKLINEFNSNPKLHLFLVSTRAGSLGINLVGANRVIVFDASWNPCHDTQAVCRVYRYGQKKPCFVYRLVTDNCLEKKIYDRQINKQGMSDRVVDECNPDAHLSIKEVTSLCWDDKADDTEVKDFTDIQDQYIDVVIQKVLQQYSKLLSKEPFQHESLLVDRKEKKLSQAEKRLAKRSYELEKQASTGTSRPLYPNNMVSNQGGIIRRGADKPMASVRPMQSEMGSQMVRGENRPRGWIPASVWQRQGMSAQEMTLPLDVVIPTNAPDRSSIVLKAGQKVMVLKSPKGIYMQLENGKIIAIRTAFKPGGNQPSKEGPKKSTGTGPEPPRRNAPAIPTNLRNNAAVSITPRGPVSSGSGTGPGRSFSQGNRPVRAVGPTHRPSPVSLTVTKKRAPVYDSSLSGGPSSGRLGIPKSDDDVFDNAVSPARPPPSPHHDSRDSMASSSSQYGGSYSNSSRSAPALPSFARDVSITPYASKDHRGHPPANPGMSHVPSGYRDPSYPGQSRAEVSITPYSRDPGIGGSDMRDESRKEYDGGGHHEYRPEPRPFASVSLDSHYRRDLGASSGPSLYNPYDDKGHEMLHQTHDPKAAPHHLYHHRPPSTHHEPDVRGYRPDKHQGHSYPPRPDSEKQFQPGEPDKSFMSSQKPPPYMQSYR